MKLIMETWRRFLAESQTVHSVSFDPRFNPRDIDAFRPLIPQIYEIMEGILNREPDWPDRIHAMTEGEIEEGELEGGGHGLYIGDLGVIKINPGMGAFNILLNFIHENLHHAKPELTGPKFSRADRHIEINESLMPAVMRYLRFHLRSNPELRDQIRRDILSGIDSYSAITRMSRRRDPTYEPHRYKR